MSESDTTTKPHAMTTKQACVEAEKRWGHQRDTSGMRGGASWHNYGGIAYRTVTERCWHGPVERTVLCQVGRMDSFRNTCMGFSEFGKGSTFEAAFADADARAAKKAAQ